MVELPLTTLDHMTRKDFPGGWYGDALPDGRYAVLIKGQRVDTHLGPVSLPGEDILFLDVAPTTPFKVAGQSQNGRGTLESREGGQFQVVGSSFGVLPNIYLPNGDLLLATASHQGFRYIDDNGRPVTGDESQRDPETGLNEFTKTGGVTVGFADNGIHIVYNGVRRVVTPGDTYGSYTVKFSRAGDSFSLFYHDRATLSSHAIWFTRDEISQFPVFSPDDSNNTGGGDSPVRLPDHIFIALKAARSKYPTPMAGRAAELLNEIAFSFKSEGWGLQRKEGGTTCSYSTLPSVACDILRNGNLGWDVLGDAEGAAVPVQSESGPADPATFVEPVPIIIDPGGEVDEEDPGVSLEEFDALAAFVASLKASIEVLQGRVTDLENAERPDLSNFVVKGTEIVVSGSYTDRGVFSTTTKEIELKGKL